MPDPPRRSAWAALAVVTAAALALRLPYLGNQSLWYDEVFTRSLVRMSSIGDVWHGVTATEATPPLYYMVTWAWGKLFRIHSDAALRTTAVLAAPLIAVLSAQGDSRTDHIGSVPLGERLGHAGRELAMGPNVPRAWLEIAGLVLAAAGVAAGLLAARRLSLLRVPAVLAAVA